MVSITTTWTAITYPFGSLLTSTKMTNLFNNVQMTREWMGETYVNSAVQDHNHNGLNSSLLPAGAISTVPTTQFFIGANSGQAFPLEDGVYQFVKISAGLTVRRELFDNSVNSWYKSVANISDGVTLISSGYSRLISNTGVSSIFILKY